MEGLFLGLTGHEEALSNVCRFCDHLFFDYDPRSEPYSEHIKNAIAKNTISPDRALHQVWQAVTGKIPGRRNEKERILASMVGLTTQDIAIAHMVYQTALAQGRGMQLPL